jgi:hypothetical protein
MMTNAAHNENTMDKHITELLILTFVILLSLGRKPIQEHYRRVDDDDVDSSDADSGGDGGN